MAFELADDDTAVRDMARRFSADQLAPHAVDWDRRRYFPVEALRQAAELGLAGVYVSEADGGTGLSPLQGVLIFEALATGCPTVSAYLAIHNMCAGIIGRLGTPEQRGRWLPNLLTMRHFASYCLTEAGSGSDAAALRTTAARSGSHYLVNGEKQFISGAGTGEGFYIVFVRTGAPGPRGISALVIEEGSAGLSFGANEHKMGWNAQPTRAVIMNDVRVPVENLIGSEGDGFKIAMAALDSGRLNIAACSLGGAQTAFDRAVGHMHERQAFGRKLEAFQALRFKIADMATSLEVARVFLYTTATAAAHRADPRQTAMAKRYVTDAGFAVANDALQLLGGYGYLSDYGIEKIVRDLRVHQILEGTNEIMREIIARAIFSDSSS